MIRDEIRNSMNLFLRKSLLTFSSCVASMAQSWNKLIIFPAPPTPISRLRLFNYLDCWTTSDSYTLRQADCRPQSPSRRSPISWAVSAICLTTAGQLFGRSLASLASWLVGQSDPKNISIRSDPIHLVAGGWHAWPSCQVQTCRLSALLTRPQRDLFNTIR